MNDLLLPLSIFGVGLIVYCTAQIVLITSKIKDIEDRSDRIYQILPYRDWFPETGNKLNALKDELKSVENNLTTEIACLATKNNEDIKRSKEGFQVGDVIAYAGEETLVLDRETVTLNNREELTDYIIWNVSKGIQHETASHLEHNAIFLRRASLNG